MMMMMKLLLCGNFNDTRSFYSYILVLVFALIVGGNRPSLSITAPTTAARSSLSGADWWFDTLFFYIV